MTTPKLRILFADDDLDNREVTHLILAADGFDVVCANDSSELLKMAKEQRFDAYLLDNWMPGIPGIEVCRQLREFDPLTPVIFYSAAVYETDIRQALDAGAQCYLTKPGHIGELIGAVRTAIANRPI